MVAFGHTAVGAAIGVAAFELVGPSRPVEGLVVTGVLGIVSHYMADAVPHGHFFPDRRFKEVVGTLIVFDVLGSIILFTLAAVLSHGAGLWILYILFGIGGSQLPDVVDGLIYTGILPKTGFLRFENWFHQRMHWHGSGENGLPWKLKRDIWQITAAVLSLLLILKAG